MRPPLSFFVTGTPAGQPRVKATAFGGHARVYTPTMVVKDGFKREHPATAWKRAVRDTASAEWAKAGLPPVKWSGPLCVNLTFYLPRPKSHYQSNGALKPTAPMWCEQKPDRDNADKAVLDALTDMGLWGDDKQVCDGRIQKRYAAANPWIDDQRPGCLIEIKECE